ncbi:MAG: hypothetical protein H6741_16370 [Alphaproteobacteria bacterium]|nr:hypothetical protein [Alphaproteobacteria bacterium]
MLPLAALLVLAGLPDAVLISGQPTDLFCAPSGRVELHVDQVGFQADAALGPLLDAESVSDPVVGGRLLRERLGDEVDAPGLEAPRRLTGELGRVLDGAWLSPDLAFMIAMPHLGTAIRITRDPTGPAPVSVLLPGPAMGVEELVWLGPRRVAFVSFDTVRVLSLEDEGEALGRYEAQWRLPEPGLRVAGDAEGRVWVLAPESDRLRVFREGRGGALDPRFEVFTLGLPIFPFALDFAVVDGLPLVLFRQGVVLAPALGGPYLFRMSGEPERLCARRAGRELELFGLAEGRDGWSLQGQRVRLERSNRLSQQQQIEAASILVIQPR